MPEVEGHQVNGKRGDGAPRRLRVYEAWEGNEVGLEFGQSTVH